MRLGGIETAVALLAASSAAFGEGRVVITEIMYNTPGSPDNEYVEIYNPTSDDIDLAGLYVTDDDSWDALVAWDGGSTLLASQGHALIVDPDYAGNYTLPAGLVIVTTGDSTIGNGLSAGSFAANEASLLLKLLAFNLVGMLRGEFSNPLPVALSDCMLFYGAWAHYARGV